MKAEWRLLALLAASAGALLWAVPFAWMAVAALRPGVPADIASQIELWRGRLLDTSKRNRLISFSTGRSGGIRLVHPPVDEIWGTLVANNGTILNRVHSQYSTLWRIDDRRGKKRSVDATICDCKSSASKLLRT